MPPNLQIYRRFVRTIATPSHLAQAVTARHYAPRPRPQDPHKKAQSQQDTAPAPPQQRNLTCTCTIIPDVSPSQLIRAKRAPNGAPRRRPNFKPSAAANLAATARRSAVKARHEKRCERCEYGIAGTGLLGARVARHGEARRATARRGAADVVRVAWRNSCGAAWH